MEPISRRNALAGAALVGVGLPALAACSNSSPSDSGGSTGSSSGPTIDCSCHGSKFSAVDGSVVNGPATQPLAEAPVAVKGADVEVDGEVIAATSDIPEGGGKIFPDQQVVVTQPDQGDFKAFSAICTHQKCLVTSVEPG